MNLNVLPINVMLALSKRWLSDPEIRAQLLPQSMGAGLLLHLEQAHGRLGLQSERRRRHAVTLADLTRRMAKLGARHDSKARALHAVLQGLIEGADDPALASEYQALQELLFPEQLLIVNRSYTYRAGAVEALQRRVTADIMSQMERTVVGNQTLAEWYRAWVAAGDELGNLWAQRQILLKRTARGGTGAADVDLRAARQQWIGTVRTFLSAIAIMDIDRHLRESLLSSLEAAVARAVRSRGGGEDGAGDQDGGGEDGAGDQDGTGPGDDIGDGERGDGGESGDGAGDDAPLPIADARTGGPRAIPDRTPPTSGRGDVLDALSAHGPGLGPASARGGQAVSTSVQGDVGPPLRGDIGPPRS